MVATLAEMKTLVEKMIGRRDHLLEQHQTLQDGIAEKSRILEKTVKARAFVQTVAKETQQKIEFEISNLVSMALASVFPDPYEVQLKFVERRNATEADIIFLKNGNETDDILNNGGGGVADIASFALRVALWKIKKSRPTFILDEPDKFLHNPGYQEKASLMMKELCDKMGIQIIMVSDQANIIAAADNIIRVEQENGISIVGEERENG